jgi:hypothetical protein
MTRHAWNVAAGAGLASLVASATGAPGAILWLGLPGGGSAALTTRAAGNVSAGLANPGAEGTATAPLPAPPVTTLSVAEMAPLVRTRAGCLPRDAVDQAYIELQGGWDVTGTRPLRLGPGSQ